MGASTWRDFCAANQTLDETPSLFPPEWLFFVFPANAEDSPREEPHFPLVVGGAMLYAAVKVLKTLSHHPRVFGAEGGKKSLVCARPQPNMGEGAQLRLRGDVEDLPFGFFGKMAQCLAEKASEHLIGGTSVNVAIWRENRVVLFENT